jgi:hypothetical protein
MSCSFRTLYSPHQPQLQFEGLAELEAPAQVAVRIF